MTPQAFSYATVGTNGMIYVPPYGLNASINYMLKMNPVTFEIIKISLLVDNSTEKWQHGIVIDNKIYFLPYNENKIIILNTDDDSIEYETLPVAGKGKYIQGHIVGDEIIALPYGEHETFDYVLHFNTKTKSITMVKLEMPINDQKKWHTTQVLNNIIYGVPRGESLTQYFPYRIEYNCVNQEYSLIDMSNNWKDYDAESYSNKKFTTLAKANNGLFAAPYSENANFDVLLSYDGVNWNAERINIKTTSRKYFTSTVTKNNKIFFPPAGHDENWSEMLIIDSNTNKWHTIDLKIGKESKKYFAGVENSKGKIYYIPRGGCVCEPVNTWKSQGDLAEVLVVDTNSEKFYTIDISEYFKDNTTIEKYNNCIIKDDIIYAFPYGESESFQTVLVFDTIKERVIHTIDLNDI